jgi:hypothetical protein
MSDQDLRELLREQVADVTTTDLSQAAWATASRRRRRRRGAIAVAGAAAVVAAVAGASVVASGHGTGPQPSHPSRPAPLPSTAGPDAHYQGLPVWWSPDLAQELELPWSDQLPLLRDIDPARASDDLATIQRAVAAFGRDDEVVLVAPDGSLHRLPVDLDRPATDESGYEVSPYGPSMLSPDGTHLVFPQAGSLAVYDVPGHRWSTIEVGTSRTAYVTWATDDLLLLPSLPERPGPMVDLQGGDAGTGEKPAVRVFHLQRSMQNPVGPAHGNGEGASAQSWGMGPGLPVRDPSAYLGGPASLVVTGRPEGTSVLAFMTEADRNRWMDAPAVAGWLDADTVVYESVADDRDLLISWKVGTHTFRRVATLPSGWTASFPRSLHS